MPSSTQGCSSSGTPCAVSCPPSQSSSSTSTTRAPSRAAVNAADTPPRPPPTISTSAFTRPVTPIPAGCSCGMDGSCTAIDVLDRDVRNCSNLCAMRTGKDRRMDQIPTPSFLPTGRANVLSIIGHPIRQVRSPIALNTELARRGIDAVLVPIDIEAGALGAFFTVLRAFENSPGAIVTIPHKIASAGYVDALSDRARLLGAINMVRRLPGGRLEGDMSDGLGFLAAAAQHGISARGKSVAVFGGGAVGSAFLLACCEAGASRVAFHEPDGDRRAALQRLADSAGFTDRVTLDAIS